MTHKTTIWCALSAILLSNVCAGAESNAVREFASNFYNLSMQWNAGANEAVITAKDLNAIQSRSIVRDYEQGKSGVVQPYPWLAETCIGNWHYDIDIYERHGYKKPGDIIPLLLDVVSKNGNLMLNIPL